MKKIVFPLVMAVCAALNADNTETVQHVMQKNNIRIIIKEVVNNTNNDIKIVEASTGRVILNIPAGKAVNSNYKIEINDPILGLPLDSHMSSDDFLIQGWDSLGENVKVKFRVSARAEDGEIQRVGLGLVGDSDQDPTIDFQRSSVIFGQGYKLYNLFISFEDAFEDSKIEIKLEEGFDEGR